MNGRDGSLSMSLQEFAARDLVIDLIGEAGCFNSMEGIQKLVNACESGVVYEDGMEAVPIVGKSNVANFLSSSSTKHRRRLDKVSDGTTACGYTWTWITDNEEGLRGTTFVQLNPQSGLIQYICELFEPVVKPGDAIVDLLKTVTQDYVADEEKEETKFAIRTPTKASDIASYMFQEVQVQNVTDVVRFYSPDIVYQDFNYPKAFRGVEEAKEFLEKFISIQGIDFIPIQFDDGQTSTCFTWKIQVMDAPDSILGISFYETNEDGKISFIRDIAESAIKPPILGSIARKLRPQLGVFSPLPLGSRLFGIS
eukprot:CAMPEP_0197833630 /NCGR_PEP_ID=MMETSP1437-20131217/19632_1 /TAXON_ID=49252 ORGANISM="Eucampia antarctica, Strain CCMP1452" /NCGR_SAMPLE_ID=MMETSP1437 /ASSEMBLY_ACC=CAM_ASM_001096 /LENGTH=309 /DNA_ID=CAMNT_0043437799 /DNA_START=169 /DNA_END=1098 /DNA_ORIENTATION=+